MKVKKILASTCAAVMISAMTVSGVTAADSVKVTVGSAEAKAGETFSVNLDLADIPAAGINACDFGIKYDSSVITVTDVKLGDIAKEEDNDALEGVDALETNIETGLVSILYGLSSVDSANYMKSNGTFLVISGTVSNNANAGDKSDLEVVAIDRLASSGGSATNTDVIFGNLADDNETATVYTPTITNGLVTVVDGDTPTKPTDPTKEDPTLPSFTGDVSQVKYGDANLDGDIGAADVATLVKYKLDPTTYPLGKGDEETEALAKENSDVVKDGTLDTADISWLQSYVLTTITVDRLGTSAE